jgi:hypothetical protein
MHIPAILRDVEHTFLNLGVKGYVWPELVFGADGLDVRLDFALGREFGGPVWVGGEGEGVVVG